MARVAVPCSGDSFSCLANVAVITRDASLSTLFAEPGKQVLQAVYGSGAPFSAGPSQAFRMEPEDRGRAAPIPDIPLERFGSVMLINPDYFSHDRPARFSPVYEKENVMLVNASPRKGC